MMYNITDYIRTIPDYPVKGINFYDVNSLFAGPVFSQVIDDLVSRTDDIQNVTHIVGVESRGFVLGAAIAYAMDLPFVMVRKKGAKYPGKLLEESYTLEYGEATLTLQQGLLGHTDRVIITDDLIATGGSLTATGSLVEQTGATVLAGLAIIELAYITKQLSMPTHCLKMIYGETSHGK